MLNVVMLNVVMLNVIMLNVVMLNVVMLNVVMLNVVMLNVVMLNVVMLSVVTPENGPSYRSILRRQKVLLYWPRGSCKKLGQKLISFSTDSDQIYFFLFCS